MLAVLEQKIQRQKIRNIEPLLSEKDKIPLENESVDLLITVNTLHEIPNKKRFSQRYERVLRPKGQAVNS